MKVLRTALFSAFLMICFMNIGHAQRSGTPVNLNNGLAIENVIAEHYIFITNPENGIVDVQYDATTTLPNTVTEIIDESDGTVLYSQNLLCQGEADGNGGVNISNKTSISVKVHPNFSDGFALIECRVYNPETGDMARAVCIVTGDVGITEGGGN